MVYVFNKKDYLLSAEVISPDMKYKGIKKANIWSGVSCNLDNKKKDIEPTEINYICLI